MTRIQLSQQAPAIELKDFKGSPFRLADYRGRKNVLLIFNRGFVCPFCQRFMAQLQSAHEEFEKRNAVIVVAGPEGEGAFREYWQSHALPFIGLPDPSHSVLKKYGQEVNLFKLGRMPAQVMVDRNGVVRFVHYGSSMADIPSNRELLDLLDQINAEK